MIHILLVDDHPLVSEGTKLIIEKEKDMKVHIETSCSQALEIVDKLSFDVMLFDLQMPEMDGFELCKRVLAKLPDANILIYSGYEILPHFDLLMESGAIGHISKTASKDQVIRAIRCALNKETVMPASLLREIYYGAKQSKKQDTKKERVSISDKEKLILKELIRGKTNKDIAQSLFLGQRSLEYSLTHLFQKLGVQTRVEAVVKAQELGLIDT
ncbi:response regulator transcription factor [Bacillus sp. EB01]|uniref:response regulator transcription factor n=1 Tax=Bacillus sp. EB01 TaxID=1347086 RepID=UPI0005C7840B|nr:response regulator transcription factor [Bacillus sp. EB01]